jgi:cellulose synthase/poly-beta-1,6-N-acetylglucosamine synthase-like glycosyltransferase
MTTIIFIILGFYILLIGSYIYGFDKVSEFHLSDILPKTKFTVIIAFRNESENLPHLIKSLNKLNYPKSHFEISFVNDDSEDNSVEIIQNEAKNTSLNFQIINRKILTHSPKKDAITTGIETAKYDWIITTDADCEVTKYWLDSFDAYIQNTSYNLIAGPVTYHYKNTILHQFQTLDFISLIGSTIGSFGLKQPYMANGANLAYKVSFFKELNGFAGNSTLASGDDVFLLQKAIKFNKKEVGFLKSKQALVTTKPLDSLNSLISQRLRWASKSTHYSSLFGKITGIIVLLTNVFIIATIVLACTKHISITTCIYIWIVKLSIDFLLMYKTTRFFNQEVILKSFFWSSLLYPFFICYVVVLSLFKGYNWKGRAFRK